MRTSGVNPLSWLELHKNSLARPRPMEACAQLQPQKRDHDQAHPSKGKTKTGESLSTNTAQQMQDQDWGSLCTSTPQQMEDQDWGKPGYNRSPAKVRPRPCKSWAQPQPSRGLTKTREILWTTQPCNVRELSQLLGQFIQLSQLSRLNQLNQLREGLKKFKKPICVDSVHIQPDPPTPHSYVDFFQDLFLY